MNGWCTAVQPPSSVRLEHREVGHPEELPAGVVHQAEPAADLEPGRAEQRQRVGAGAGGEEGAVADLGADGLAQALALGLGQVLGDRAAERAVLEERARRPGPRAPRCLANSCQASKTLRGCVAPPGMTTAPTCGAWKTRNGVSAKYAVQVDELDAEADVGLVDAEAAHRLVVGHPRERRRDLDAEHVAPDARS